MNRSKRSKRYKHDDPLRYQSPIPLKLTDEVFHIKQCINVRGRNRGAKYNPEDHIFELRDKVVMKIDNKKYRLVEYHFHTPAEHPINCKCYPAEIHYVFYEIKKGFQKSYNEHKIHKKADVCGCKNIDDEDILVIGRVIKDKRCSRSSFSRSTNLNRLQVKIPSTYFEYDGSLTGEGDGTVPVRWIVGKHPIRLPLREILRVTKSARAIQPLDDRIVLFQ